MDYILRHPLSENDIDFVNNTTIDFKVISISRLDNNYDNYDSGWCDASTGARIINSQDRVMFKNVNESQLTFLTLKYQDRLIEAHDGLKAIYRVPHAER